MVAAATGFGLAEFVTERSAAFPTVTVAVALLLAEFGSVVVAETVSVSEIVAPPVTATTNVKTAGVLTARLLVAVHL